MEQTITLPEYILAIDQGTTGTTASLVDQRGLILFKEYQEISQHYPQPGWIEQDPLELIDSVNTTVQNLVNNSRINPSQIKGVGVTNQRETTLVWDKTSGVPIHNAIVWQCRRTTYICEKMKREGLGLQIQRITGLPIDPYFSGTKIRWILDNVPNGQEKAENGDLAFGTVDSWLVWYLTGGNKHITDPTNAARTMLYDIRTLSWSQDMMSVLNIPASMLPEVVNSSGIVGFTTQDIFNGHSIPIAGIIGDQQSSMFGQACFDQGMSKCTYGTGSFLLANTGGDIAYSEKGLISTIAWNIDNRTTYALEGAVFSTGSTVQWLKDQMGIIPTIPEVEALAETVSSNGGVYLVPAFTGLGAPYWDMRARGTIFGLTRGSTKAHIARAVLESTAYQCHDVFKNMAMEMAAPLTSIRVDGGGSQNSLLMQFQADILGIPIEETEISESTSLGAAFMVGLAIGFWDSLDALRNLWHRKSLYEPSMDLQYRHEQIKYWERAVDRSRSWLD